ncbi:MAG TPA: sodium:solute symporter family protein [Methanomassiliicoccales archaeon]|nr:sodium:solute symporter family protein [Methanomassiliicoccales archaeon]
MVDAVLFGTITLVYLAITFYLGYLGYKKTRKAEDYMVCGRKIHPLVLALSYGATFISTSAIVGFGGVAGQLGMGLIWLTVLCIGVGILIAFIIYGKKTREVGSRVNAVTFPDLLGKKYRSKFIQSATATMILAGMPLYTAAILIGGARFIETTLAIQYDLALVGFAIIVAAYVVLGGLIAVMYTDALQGGIMLVGMTALIILTYVLLGGVGPANQELTSMADLVPEALAAAGMTGWTSMPELGSSIWFTLITTLVLGVGIGVLAQPQLVVRFMTVKDNRSLNRAIMVGGPFVLIMTGVAFTAGALSNVYFYQTSGITALEAAGGNVDSIIPLFINEALPEWFVVIFMLALLAAAMSTLSSLFHTMRTSMGYDLWGNLRTKFKGADVRETERMRLSFKPSQIGTMVMIVVSVALAYILPISIIARATVMFMGLCVSAFLPALTHALYSKNPSTKAAITSLLFGTSAWFLWTVFVHVKESAALGICRALFGVDALLPMPLSVIDPLIIALPISMTTLTVVWYLDKKMCLLGKEAGVPNNEG